MSLSGTSKLQIKDDGNTSVSNTINVGVSKTFDNGMVLSLSQNMNAASSEMTVTSDAVSVTFGDFDQNEKAPGPQGSMLPHRHRDVVAPHEGHKVKMPLSTERTDSLASC